MFFKNNVAKTIQKYRNYLRIDIDFATNLIKEAINLYPAELIMNKLLIILKI